MSEKRKSGVVSKRSKAGNGIGARTSAKSGTAIGARTSTKAGTGIGARTSTAKDSYAASSATGVTASRDRIFNQAIDKLQGNSGAAGTTVTANQLRTYRTRWGVWVLLIASWCGSLAAAIIRGGAVETFLLTVLGMIILLSALSPLLAVRGLSVSRAVAASQVKDGGEASVRLTISRSRAIPFIWFAVRDEMFNSSSLAKGRLEYRFVAAPLFRKEIHIDYTALSVNRGHHCFDTVTITVGDWLGLTAIKRQIACSDELLVLPALPELGERRLELNGGIVNGEEAGGSITVQQGDGGDMGSTESKRRHSGIGPESRPYREGDSLRHVNWRAVAKGRGLHTKEHTLEQPAELTVVMDTSISGYGGDERLFDACTGWAAQAIERTAAAGGMVRLIVAQGNDKPEQVNYNHAQGNDKRNQANYSQAKGNEKPKQAAAYVANSKLDEKRKSPNRMMSTKLAEYLARLCLSGETMKMDLIRQELNGMKQGGVLRCFSADWRNGQSWGLLAAYAAERGCRMELYVVTKQSVLSFSMREQQRFLEGCGVQMTWLAFPEQMNRLPQMVEGGSIHVYN
ncbi:MAG: DUF58 domain-containing protein [Candidatus Pristimantibacillus sp.]